MGGYFDYSYFSTKKVLIEVAFNADYSEFPSTYWLGGVSSVAGAYNSTYPSGWTYQNGVALNSTNYVIWSPQSWYIFSENPNEPEYSWSDLVGNGNDIGWYVRTVKDDVNGHIEYKVFWYPTFLSFDHDAPTVYTRSHDTNDINLFVGIMSYAGVVFKHFQFGVESNVAIDETNWEVLNDHICYYDSSSSLWKYKAGKSVQGADAYLTYQRGETYSIPHV
jgi:hypothetical protein